jgi:hypothetical protein
MNSCPSCQHQATKRDDSDAFGRQRYHCRPYHRDFTAYFWAACCTIAGMEMMHAGRKGELMTPRLSLQTPAE